PAGDLASCVPKRQSTHVEPTVDAVGTAHAVFDVIFPRTQGLFPSSDHGGKVIGMNDFTGFPTLQLFEGSTEIFQNMAIDVFDFAIRCHEGHQSRNAIGDRAVMIRTRALSGFGTLEVFDIGTDSTPLDDCSRSIDQRPRTEGEPAIFTVEAT